jgi:hypothetical protein
VITKLARGVAFGKPDDSSQQQRVNEACMDLLSKDAPIEPVYLGESME